MCTYVCVSACVFVCVCVLSYYFIVFMKHLLGGMYWVFMLYKWALIGRSHDGLAQHSGVFTNKFK